MALGWIIMDVNLTGTLAANVSLMQPSKTDYLRLITQITLTLLTIGATLGGVYLKGLQDNKENLRSMQRKIKK